MEAHAAFAAGVDSSASHGASAGIPPNQSLYVNNLNTKISKSKLKESLYQVFSPFGKVLDVVTIKTKELRGQAWVVFADVASASTAMRQMQGFPFYDKPMRLAYAKEKSDAAVKVDGTQPPAREKRKRQRGEDEAGAPPSKRAATAEGVAGQATAAAPPAAAAVMPAAVPVPGGMVAAVPSATLLVTGLPAEATSEVLQALFGAFAGMAAVRHVPQRGLAFVDYDSEATATPALLALNSFAITPTAALSVAYAPRA